MNDNISYMNQNVQERWIETERYIDIISEVSSKTLLVVGDDEVDRSISANLFSDEYPTGEARNGHTGLNKILAVPHRYCAVLLGMMMPVMGRPEVLQRLKQAELLDKIPVSLVTAGTSDGAMKEVYRLDVTDVISKLTIPYVVTRWINSVVELFCARHGLSNQVMHQQKELLEQAEHIAKLNQGMTEALFTAIEFRSMESGDHIRQVYETTRYILKHTELGINIDVTSIEQIALASTIYNVGKIAISDVIPNRPGKLTSKEFGIMKTHTIQGALLLGRVPQLRENDIYRYAYDITGHHYERWDRPGYPDGLKGNETSLWAQIVPLADVYNVLSRKRVYKDAYPHIRVLEMIQGGACNAFNPHLPKCFFSVEGTFSKLYRH